MKLCNDKCTPICDFCKNYDDDMRGNISDLKKGSFAGEGYCKAKKVRVYAHDCCNDDFECFNVEE